MRKLIEMFDQMKTSRVRNYVIAGLDSYLLENGKVRLFENSRNHQDQITPHSHRFDFACVVIKGSVTNRIWNRCLHNEGDLFLKSTLTYSGKIGEHSQTESEPQYYTYNDTRYTEGNIYTMKSNEIHSINFSRGAMVLFFEGPDKSNTSEILEPEVDGVRIKTYQKLDYMFLGSEL